MLAFASIHAWSEAHPRVDELPTYQRTYAYVRAYINKIGSVYVVWGLSCVAQTTNCVNKSEKAARKFAQSENSG